MARVGKNNKFSGGFERFTKRRLTEKDVESHNSKIQKRGGSNKPLKNTDDDFFSSYEEFEQEAEETNN